MNFLSFISDYNKSLNSFIWDKFGIVFLIFTGILTTVLLGFFQLRHIGLWWNKTFGSLFKKDTVSLSGDKNSISAFQSFCTSLAATLGVGNIVGVSTAICLGGPGAVFWMWIAAILGMATNYSENVLGLYFRRKNFSGEWSGGAMYYLADGLGAKRGAKSVATILSYAFALFTLLASFGIGSMGQINKIVINISSAFPAKFLSSVMLYDNVSAYSLLLGIVLFFLASIIVLGGIKRISRVTEKLVPFMIIFFISGSLFVLIKNYTRILPAFSAIFSSAFNIKASAGGTAGICIGTAFKQGFKRGVFSNESGLGSSVIVHASSSVTEPAEQGMWGIFEVFCDTILICTITALVILTSGVYDINVSKPLFDDATMVAKAFNSVFPYASSGEKFVAVSIFLFAFSTVLGWNYYGAKAWEYLFGTRLVYIYRILHLLSIIPGALLTSSLAWDISDTFNGLMMIPNLIGVISLSGLVIKITKNYKERKLKGKNILPMTSYFKDIEKYQRGKGKSSF